MGGIINGDEVFKVFNVGVSVVMVYIGMVYGGFGIIMWIKNEMWEKLVIEDKK